MNPLLGWALAAAFAFASWQAYGWAGLAFAASAIVFWLLLQFNRAVRVIKNAAEMPLGEVPNAVMFHTRLQRGDTMLKIVGKTKSLGRKVEGRPDDWVWRDAAGDEVELAFERGRLARWKLRRAAADVPPAAAPGDEPASPPA